MIFNAVRSYDLHSIKHHGIKGQKWGERNAETLFKYGLSAISPAIAKASGGQIDPLTKNKLAQQLKNGEISLAEYRSATMNNMISNSSTPVSPERRAELQQQLLKGEITAEQYREMTTPGGDTGENPESSGEAGMARGRNYLKEAMEKAKAAAAEGEEAKSGSGGGGGGKGGGGGGGGKGSSGTEKEENEKEEPWWEDSIDEGPMERLKSAFWNQQNAKRDESSDDAKRMQRSISGRSSSSARVAKVTKDINRSNNK